MKNNKGFTLVELLAVIVIMGILMMVAIPSVTRTIENSRKDTFVDIAKSYGNAVRTLWTSDNLTCEGVVSSAVDDGDYYILINSKEGAKESLPVLVDQGGKSSWGNRDVNGYVRVNVSTTPGIDNNGDGIYEAEPKRTTKFYVALSDGTHGLIDDGNIVSDKLVKGNVVMALSEEEKKKVELTVDDGRLDCAIDPTGEYYCAAVRPVKNITGVCVDNQTNVGITGKIGTLAGEDFLSNLVLKHNTLIATKPTLTTSSNNTNDESGLYSSTDTNSGQATYYFRGNVTNNYVSFAGLTWRIIRINEDGTIRLILNDRIGGTTYKFNTAYNNYTYMYYSNSDTAKPTVDSWYQTNITDKGYDSYVATSQFCEQAKVKRDSYSSSGNAIMDVYTVYTPNFKCTTDGNGKGILNSKVGLITYDEAIHAGGYYDKSNSSYYLYNGSYHIWTMSPAGFRASSAVDWNVWNAGYVGLGGVDKHYYWLCPVINLNANIIATGTGTSTDPYVIITD